MRVNEISVQQAAAAKVTRPLPSLAVWGVATQDYIVYTIHDCKIYVLLRANFDLKVASLRDPLSPEAVALSIMHVPCGYSIDCVPKWAWLQVTVTSWTILLT